MPRGLKIEATPRNDFEKAAGDQLKAAGIKASYEPTRIPVSIPARQAVYIPDWVPDDCNIILETKGRFGGVGKHGSERDGAAARQKMVLVKQQHPELDIRFVFQNSKNRIYKGSKTTYAKWADDHGFKWAHKVVPQAWIEEIRKQQGSSHAASKPRPRTANAPNRSANARRVTARPRRSVAALAKGHRAGLTTRGLPRRAPRRGVRSCRSA